EQAFALLTLFGGDLGRVFAGKQTTQRTGRTAVQVPEETVDRRPLPTGVGAGDRVQDPLNAVPGAPDQATGVHLVAGAYLVVTAVPGASGCLGDLVDQPGPAEHRQQVGDDLLEVVGVEGGELLVGTGQVLGELAAPGQKQAIGRTTSGGVRISDGDPGPITLGQRPWVDRTGLTRALLRLEGFVPEVGGVDGQGATHFVHQRPQDLLPSTRGGGP